MVITQRIYKGNYELVTHEGIVKKATLISYNQQKNI